MRTKRLIVQPLLVVALLIAAATHSVWAQTSGGKIHFDSVDDQAFPQMRAVVTIVDVNGIPFTNLTEDDISAFEDGNSVSLKATEAVNQAVPVSFLLAIDKSGSMTAKSTINPGKSKLDDAKDAAVRFLEKLQPADRAGILAFGDKVDLNHGLDDDCVSDSPSKEHAFTDDKGALINCVNGLSTVAGQVTTPLYDAAYKAVREAAREASTQQNTPVVILFTDGKEGDASGRPVSENPRVAAELAARQDHIALFTIGLGSDADTSYLQALAENTGGEFSQTPDAARLDSIYNGVAARLRTQYDLNWQSKIEADGSPHQLDIKVTVGGKELANQIPFIAQKPLIPGIRFRYKHPTGLFNLGHETEIVPLAADQELRTNWTIVPDISARNDIERVEYYFNDETQPVFVAKAFPFNLPWAATRRGVKESTPFTVRAVAYDKQGNQGEASISLNVLPGGIDPAWLVLIMGLILLVAVVVLIFALRRQHQLEWESVPSSTVPGGGFTESMPPSDVGDVGPSGIGHAAPPVGQVSGSPPFATAAARLVVTAGPEQGREFQLTRPEMRVGRGSDSDIRLEDPTVSRTHIAIRQESGQYYLYDLGALNPAKVNGRQVSRCRLENDDSITIGNITLVFKLGNG